MTLLVAGLVVFFGVHLVPASPRLRARLVGGIGEWPYKGAFSVVALAGLAMVVAGMGRAPHVALWQPPAGSAAVAAILMGPALILLAAANFRNNIRRVARHPMSLGVLLWSLSHLWANGDLDSLLLFGGFAAFALFDMRPSGQRAADAGELLAVARDWVAVAVGLAAYLGLAALHGRLFGVAVFPAWPFQ